MRPATRACRSFGLAHAIIWRRLQIFVNSKNGTVRAIQILASSVPLTEHLNFEMFSTFKLGQAETIAFQRDAQAMLASHALAPIDRHMTAHKIRTDPEQRRLVERRWTQRERPNPSTSAQRHSTE